MRFPGIDGIPNPLEDNTLKVITGLKLLLKILRRTENTEYLRFVLAEKISEMVYPKYKFSEFGRLFLEDKAFMNYYESYHGTKNYHSLDQLMKLLISTDGREETAECGVFQGASSHLICRQIRSSQKQHHVFDSFEGLSAPNDKDGTYWQKGNLACSEKIVRENLKEFDFVRYYRGWIPERFDEVSDRKFCFLHLDVDLYQPTLDTLVFFYERMTPGGIILCDDYDFATCPGAKKAMDLFFSDKPEEIVCLPTGQGFVITDKRFP